MNLPKKEWLLYPPENFEEYSNHIGRETGKETATHKTLLMVGVFGSRTDMSNVGKEFDVPLEHLTTQYISTYMLNFHKDKIKKVDTKYLIDEVWILRSVFGYFETLESTISNNGIIDDGVIEGLAMGTDIYWSVSEKTDYKQNPGHWIECLGKDCRKENRSQIILTTIEALKTVGLYVLEEVIEKKSMRIEPSMVRNIKLHRMGVS